MSSSYSVKDDHPDRIGPDTDRRQTWIDKGRTLLHAFTTKDGLIGNYDYAFLFKPNLPFMKRSKRAAPFFGLNDKMPVFLALLLGFQHALSMLAGVISPPIILAGSANLSADHQSYLVSTSLIVTGILSAVQITRFHIWRSPYYIGTGLISVVGTSFAIIPVASGAFSQMYATGFCPTDANGNQLPCPKGYGALIGTAAICGLLEVAMSFTPSKILKKIFPPLVTGPTVLLIGVSLIQSGFEDWAGGSGSCMERPETGMYRLCPTVYAPHALPWGSAEFIGLGFLVFVTIILCERFGSPIMKSTAVVIGLLVSTNGLPERYISLIDHTGRLHRRRSLRLLRRLWHHLRAGRKFHLGADFSAIPLRTPRPAPARRLHRPSHGSDGRHHRHLRRLPPPSRRRNVRQPHPRRRAR